MGAALRLVQAAWPALGLVSCLAASAASAAGQTVPASAPTPPRTVSWYADNPQARAAMQLACIDDPGRLGSTPDCINAERASVEVALRAARSRTGTLDPRDPAFWSSSPETRRSQLLMCRRNPQIEHCDAARRSLLIEAGEAKR